MLFSNKSRHIKVWITGSCYQNFTNYTFSKFFTIKGFIHSFGSFVNLSQSEVYCLSKLSYHLKEGKISRRFERNFEKRKDDFFTPFEAKKARRYSEICTLMVRNRLKNYELFAKDAKDNFALVYESDNKVLQILNNIMVTKFKDGLLYDEVVGKKKRLFEALEVPIPTVVTSDYEDENEEINDPESVEDLESISRRTI